MSREAASLGFFLTSYQEGAASSTLGMGHEETPAQLRAQWEGASSVRSHHLGHTMGAP